MLLKPAFANGDTINVAAGTYIGQTTITKSVNIVGAGTVVLDGNNAGTQAVIVVNGAGITVNLTNLTVRNGPQALSGGGLSVLVGTVNTTNVVLRDNRGIAGAGAIVLYGATLNMTGGSITNNTATANASLVGAGGGAYVWGKNGATPAGKLTLDGVAVTGNIATGANLLFSGNGGGVFNAGTAVIKNSTFSGNRAIVTSAANKVRSGQGGGLFNGPQDGDDTPSLTVENTTITGGLAPGTLNATSGGAIANDETSTGGTSVSGALTLTNTELRGNEAVVGGGLYNGGTLNATGGLIVNNTALSGGGVYQSPIVVAAANPTATFDGTAFTGNTASGLAANFGNGGAIFNGEKLTLRNATFADNKAVPSAAASAVSGWGGAIFNGAWAAGDTPDLIVEDSTIDGGAVATNALIGGAVASTGNLLGVANGVPAKLALTRTTVTSNVAAAGGLYTGGPTTITGGSLDHNAATNGSAGYGGAVYAAPSPASSPAFDVTLDSVDVTDNSAAVVGGGIAALNKVTTKVLNGSTINDNTSAISGGGVYNAGDLTITASDVSGNDAAFQAGGIYNGSTVATDTPKLTMTNATVDDNTAANGGGGIVTVKGATLTATGGHINGNSAVGGGGLLVGDAAPATFDGTDFADNLASASGGGAIFNAGTLSIANSMLTGNEAVQTTGNTGLGGAIYSGSNAANAVTSLTLEAQHDRRQRGVRRLGAADLLTRRGGDEQDLHRPQHDHRQLVLQCVRGDRAVPPADDHVEHDHRQHQCGWERRASPGGSGLPGYRRHDPHRQHG